MRSLHSQETMRPEVALWAGHLQVNIDNNPIPHEVSLPCDRCGYRVMVCLKSVGLTCQCPCLTAQNRGDTPRRLNCCTTAPCPNRKLQTSIFPRPAAAVKAKERMKEELLESEVVLTSSFRSVEEQRTVRVAYRREIRVEYKASRLSQRGYWVARLVTITICTVHTDVFIKAL